MSARGKLSFTVKALFLTFIILLSLTNYGLAQEEPSSAKETAVSSEDLEGTVQTLESPEKREAFINELKSLIEAQKQLSRAEQVAEEPPRKEVSLVDWFMTEYGQLTKKAAGYIPQLLNSIRQIPNYLKSALAYILAQENRPILYKFAIIIATGIIIALIIILLIRRLTTALLKAILKQRKETTPGRVYEGLVRVVVRISPFIGLWLAVFLIFSVLGVGGKPYAVTMLFLLTLLLYEAIATLARILLNVREPKSRLLALTDEAAAYASIWVKRFLLLLVLYYFVTGALTIMKAPPQLLSLVRGILIILFPILSTLLLLQIRRIRREKEKARAGLTIWRKLLSVCTRFWPLGVGVLIWLFSIFALLKYRAGVAFLFLATLKTLVVVGILWGLLYLIDPVFDRLFTLGKETRSRFPELEEKTNRYIGSLKIIARGIIILVGIGTILDFWGLGASWFVTSELGSTILIRLVKIAITVGVALTIMDLSKFIAKQMIKPRTDANGNIIATGKKQKTLVPLIYWIIMVGTSFIGAVIVLGQLGVNVTPILAGAGIVGLAVGFGAQSLVKDFINGLLILFESSVAVGDVIIINGTGGLVEEVTLRTIKMRDLAGNVHVIPNGNVGMITNMTKEFSRYVFDVGVAYREDADEVMAVLKEIGASMQKDPEFSGDILEPLEILGLDQFGDSAVVIKARFKTKPIKQWRIGREFNRRMKKIFDERGIEIPFPHQTIYWGEPKTGPQPPLAVQVTGQLSREGKNPEEK